MKPIQIIPFVCGETISVIGQAMRDFDQGHLFQWICPFYKKTSNSDSSIHRWILQGSYIGVGFFLTSYIPNTRGLHVGGIYLGPITWVSPWEPASK